MASLPPWRSRTFGQEGGLYLLLFVVVLLTRWPFRTQYLFNWDAVNFAFALSAFDVRAHAPHPPGYFLYILVARTINAFLKDANASLVTESLLFSGMAVVALYTLGKQLFDRPTGLIAALLLIGSVTFWSYGALALSYVTLAFFASFLAGLAFQGWQGNKKVVLPLSFLYGLAGGFRAELVPFLAPLWLLSLGPLRPKERLWGIALALLGVGTWLGPTMLLSGGPAGYGAVLQAYTQTDVLQRYAVPYGGGQALWVNLRDTASYLFYALYFYAIPLALALFWRGFLRELVFSRQGFFLLVWVMPILLFFAIIHIGDPGYAFVLLPAVLVVLARFLARLLASPLALWRRIGTALLMLALLGNGALFLFHQRPLTAYGLRANDQRLESTLTAIAQEDPEGVMLLAYETYKHLRYYLPQYRATFWVDVFSDKTYQVSPPSGTKRVLLVDEQLEQLLDPSLPRAAQVLEGGSRFISFPVAPGKSLVYSGKEIAWR